MRVLVVGAGGAIGRCLIPQLAEAGHQVTGTSRSAAKAGFLRSLGAEPAVLDVLDADAARAAVAAARPDAIIYQATALTGISFSRNMDRAFGPTNRLRTDGTDNLLAAARAAGVPGRVIGVVGGGALTLPGAGAISVDALKAVNEAWLPSYMDQA